MLRLTTKQINLLIISMLILFAGLWSNLSSAGVSFEHKESKLYSHQLQANQLVHDSHAANLALPYQKSGTDAVADFSDDDNDDTSDGGSKSSPDSSFNPNLFNLALHNGIIFYISSYDLLYGLFGINLRDELAITVHKLLYPVHNVLATNVFKNAPGIQ